MDLSIIVLNYNTFENTSNCIKSILETVKDLKYEIVLVDNHSTECNPDIFKKKFPDIKLIKSDINLGFSKGNNLGIQNSIGDYVLLLNSDTIVLENTIIKTLNFIKSNKEIGVITCKLLFPNGEIQHQCRRFETISLTLLEKSRLHKLLPKSIRAKWLQNGYFDHNSSIFTDRIWGTYFMFLKKDLELLPSKKLADTFFMYGEDNEWCYQFNLIVKKKIFYCADSSIIHIMGGSKFGTKPSSEKNNIMNNNRKVYLSKYYGSFKTKLFFMITNN